MPNNAKNFIQTHNKILESIRANSISYSFEISLLSGSVLKLNSSLILTKCEFNDSGENVIILNGVYEALGIRKEMNLCGCEIKIFTNFDGVTAPLITYFITEVTKRDLDFIIKCTPQTYKYNQSILLLFSKTCRAVFGDNKCGINISQYRKKFKIKQVSVKTIMFSKLNAPSGYYAEGQVWFKIDFHQMTGFNVIKHYDTNKIELENNLLDVFRKHQYAYLTPNCDKKFGTCCNKFDNAVNFRGEPSIDGITK